MGDAAIKDFVIGDIPFGNVTQAHIVSDIVEADRRSSRDAHAQKGKSAYEMSTGQPRLRQAREHAARRAGRVEEPQRARLLQRCSGSTKIRASRRSTATLETSARIHLALGGPEDNCNGGYLDVQATTNAREA